MLALIGAVMALTLYARWWRARRGVADRAEHASFMSYLERMRIAEREQEQDPHMAAVVARYGYLVGRERSHGGRHRAPAARQRRLQNA